MVVLRFPSGCSNVSASSSISDLDFKGSAVNVTGFLKQDGTPGTAVTITVAPPGLDHQVLFNDNGDFGAASRLTYDNNSNKVGIGSTQPANTLDVRGDAFFAGKIKDNAGGAGTDGQVIISTGSGSGASWSTQAEIYTLASDANNSIQFKKASNGKFQGADNFVYDPTNKRVGIGSTLPEYLLQVARAPDDLSLIHI